MRKICSLVLFLIFIAVPLFAIEQYQGEITHTGEATDSASTAVVPLATNVKWIIPTGGSMSFASASVSLSTPIANLTYQTIAETKQNSNLLHFADAEVFKPGDVIYLGVLYGDMHTVTEVSGNTVRVTPALSADTPSGTEFIKDNISPINKLSVVGSSDGYLYGFNPANGEIYWRNSVTSQLGVLNSSPAIDTLNQIIYALSATGRLFAFNYEGEFKFAYPPLSSHTDATPVGTPIISDGYAYVVFGEVILPSGVTKQPRIVKINSIGEEIAVHTLNAGFYPSHISPAKFAGVDAIILAAYSSTSGSGIVYSLNSSDLSLNWSYTDPTMKEIAYQPLTKGNSIVVTDKKSNVFIIDNNQSSHIPIAATVGEDIANMGVIYNGDSVLIPYNDKIKRFMLAGGTSPWSGSLVGINISSPLAISNDTLIFSDIKGNVYRTAANFAALDSSIDGWSPAKEIGLNHSLPILAAAGLMDNILLLPSTDGYIYGIGSGGSFDVEDPVVVGNPTGNWSVEGANPQRTQNISERVRLQSGPLEPSLRWFADLEESIRSAAVVSYHTSNAQPIVILASGGRIFAYDGSTGAERWQWPSAGSPPTAPIASSPAVNSDGQVIFVTTTGDVYALNTTDTSATLAWSNKVVLDAPVQVSPVIGKGGTIYITTAGKSVNPSGTNSVIDNQYVYTLNNATSITGLSFETGNSGGTLYIYNSDDPDSDPVFIKEFFLGLGGGTVTVISTLNNAKKIVWQPAQSAVPDVSTSSLVLYTISTVSALTAGVTYSDYTNPLSPSTIINIGSFTGTEIHANIISGATNLFSIMVESENDYIIKAVGADDVLYTVGSYSGRNTPREIFIDKVIKSIHWIKNDNNTTNINALTINVRNVNSKSGSIYAIDSTGTNVFDFPSGAAFLSPVSGPPAIATDSDGSDILVFATFDGKIYALKNNNATPQMVWSQPVQLFDRVNSSPLITEINNESYVFVVANDGTSYLIKLTDGEIVAQFKLSQTTTNFNNSPVIGTGNVAYIVSNGGYIYRVSLKSLIPEVVGDIVSGTTENVAGKNISELVVSGEIDLPTIGSTEFIISSILPSAENISLIYSFDGSLIIENSGFAIGNASIPFSTGIEFLLSAGISKESIKFYYREIGSDSTYSQIQMSGIYPVPTLKNGVSLSAVDNSVNDVNVYYAYSSKDSLIDTFVGVMPIANVPTEVYSNPVLDSGGRLYFGGTGGSLFCFDGSNVTFNFSPRRPILYTYTLNDVFAGEQHPIFKVAGTEGFKFGDSVGIRRSDGTLEESIGTITGIAVPANLVTTYIEKYISTASMLDAEPGASGTTLSFKIEDITNIFAGDDVSILPAYNGKGYLKIGVVDNVDSVNRVINVDTNVSGGYLHSRISGIADNLAYVPGGTSLMLTFTTLPIGIEPGMICYRNFDIPDTPYYQVRSVDNSTNTVVITYYSNDNVSAAVTYPPAGNNIVWNFITFPVGSNIVFGDTTTYIQVSDSPKYNRISGDMLFMRSYSSVMPIQSPVSLGMNQVVYVGGDDGVLYAVGPIGPAGTPSELPPLPVVPRINLWSTFHADNQRLGYSLNPSPRTEALRWYSNTGSKLYSSPALGFNDGTAPLGVLYVGTVDNGLTSKGSLISYNATNGKLRWRFTDSNRMGAIHSSPTVYRDERNYMTGGTFENENIVFGTIEGSQSVSGVLNVKLDINDPVEYVDVTDAYVFVPGMSIYLKSDGAVASTFIGVVKAVDTTNNRLRLATEYLTTRDYAVLTTQVIGMTTQQGRLYSVDRSGRLNWTFPDRSAIGDSVIEPIYSSPVVDNAGNTYFVTQDAVVYAIDVNGNMLWREPLLLPGSGIGTPDATAAVTLNLSESILLVSTGIVGQNAGYLYALDAVTGLSDDRVLWTRYFSEGLLTAAPMIMEVNGLEIAIIGVDSEESIFDGALYSINVDTGAVISLDLNSPSVGATAAAVPDSSTMSIRGSISGNDEIEVLNTDGFDIGTKVRVVYFNNTPPTVCRVTAVNRLQKKITVDTPLSTPNGNVTVYTIDRVVLVPTMTGRINAYYINERGEFESGGLTPTDPVWHFNISNNSIESSPAISSYVNPTTKVVNYVAIVGSNNFKLTAFNFKGSNTNVTPLWSKDLRNRQYASPVVGAKTYDYGRAIIYQSSMDGFVYAIGDQVGLEDEEKQDPDGPGDDVDVPSEWGDGKVPSTLSATKRVDRLVNRDGDPLSPPISVVKANSGAPFYTSSPETNWWRVVVTVRNTGEGLIDNVKITDIIPLDLSSLVEIYFEDDESSFGYATRRISASGNVPEGETRLLSYGEYTGTDDAVYKVAITGGGAFTVTKEIGGMPAGTTPGMIAPSTEYPLGDGIIIQFTKAASNYTAGEVYEFRVYARHNSDPIHYENKESWEIIWDNGGDGYIFYGRPSRTAGLLGVLSEAVSGNELKLSDVTGIVVGMELEIADRIRTFRVNVVSIDTTENTITIDRSLTLNLNALVSLIPNDRKTLATITGNASGSIIAVNNASDLKKNMDVRILLSDGRSFQTKIKEIIGLSVELYSNVTVSSGDLIVLVPPPNFRQFTFYVRVKDIYDPYEDDTLNVNERPIIDIENQTEKKLIGSTLKFNLVNAPSAIDPLQGQNILSTTGNTYDGDLRFELNENTQVPMYNGWSDTFKARMYYNGLIAAALDTDGTLLDHIPSNIASYVLALVGEYDHNNRVIVRDNIVATNNSWVRVFSRLNQSYIDNGQPMYFVIPANDQRGNETVLIPGGDVSDFALEFLLRMDIMQPVRNNNRLQNADLAVYNRILERWQRRQNPGIIPYGYRLTTQQSRARTGRRVVWGRELPVEQISGGSLVRLNEWESDIVIANPVLMDDNDIIFDEGLPRDITVKLVPVRNLSLVSMDQYNVASHFVHDSVYMLRNNLYNVAYEQSLASVIMNDRFGSSAYRGDFWEGFRYDEYANNTVLLGHRDINSMRGLILNSNNISNFVMTVPYAAYHPEGVFITMPYDTSGMYYDDGRYFLGSSTPYKYGESPAVVPISPASLRAFWDLNGDGQWQVGEPYYIYDEDNAIGYVSAIVQPIGSSIEAIQTNITMPQSKYEISDASSLTARFANISFINEGTKITDNSSATSFIQAALNVYAANLNGTQTDMTLGGLLPSRISSIIRGSDSKYYVNPLMQLAWIPFNYGLADGAVYIAPIGAETVAPLVVPFGFYMNTKLPRGYYGADVKAQFGDTPVDDEATITAKVAEERISIVVPEQYHYNNYTNSVQLNLSVASDGLTFNWVNYLNGNEKDPTGIILPDSDGILGVFVSSNSDVNRTPDVSTDTHIWYRPTKRLNGEAVVKGYVQHPIVNTEYVVRIEVTPGVANQTRSLLKLPSAASNDTVDLIMLIRKENGVDTPHYFYPIDVDITNSTIDIVPFDEVYTDFSVNSGYRLEIVSHPFMNVTDLLLAPSSSDLGLNYKGVLNHSNPSVSVRLSNPADENSEKIIYLSWTVSGVYTDRDHNDRNFSFIATKEFNPDDPDNMDTFQWILPRGGGASYAMLNARVFSQNVPQYEVMLYEGILGSFHGLYYAGLPKMKDGAYVKSDVDIPLSDINNAFTSIGRPQVWLDTKDGQEIQAPDTKVNIIFQGETFDGNTDLYYARLAVDKDTREVSVDMIVDPSEISPISNDMRSVPSENQFVSDYFPWYINDHFAMQISVAGGAFENVVWANKRAISMTEYEVSGMSISGGEYKISFNPYRGIATVKTGNITDIKITGYIYLQRLTDNLAQDIDPTVVVERWHVSRYDGLYSDFVKDFGADANNLLADHPRIWIYWARRHTDNLGVRSYYKSFRQKDGTGALYTEELAEDNYRSGEKILPLTYMTQDSKILAIKSTPNYFERPQIIGTVISADGYNLTYTPAAGGVPAEVGMRLWVNSDFGAQEAIILAVSGSTITINRYISAAPTNAVLHVANGGAEGGTWVGTVSPMPLRRPVYLDSGVENYLRPAENDLFLQMFIDTLPAIRDSVNGL